MREPVAEADGVRERVGEAMVLLVPAEIEAEAEAEAAAELARDEMLAIAELAEARTLERAAEAEERAEAALETAADPPVNPNWPEKLLVEPRRTSIA